MKTNIKLRVTPEQSKAVQKICFTNGIDWSEGENKISYTFAPYLFIKPARLWFRTYADHNDGIETEGYTEVDADLFIRTKGTCEEPIRLVDNSSNSKSKKDMFKQYGFEVPDFDCTILAKVGSWLIGYTQTDSMAPVPAMWFEHTGKSSGKSDMRIPNLTPIKKPWYETCKFPVLVWNADNDLVAIETRKDYNDSYLSICRPLPNAEIDQLKQDF